MNDPWYSPRPRTYAGLVSGLISGTSVTTMCAPSKVPSLGGSSHPCPPAPPSFPRECQRTNPDATSRRAPDISLLQSTADATDGRLMVVRGCRGRTESVKADGLRLASAPSG